MTIVEFFLESAPTDAAEGIVTNADGVAIGFCCNGQLYHGGKFATDRYVADPTTPYQPGQSLYAKDNLFTPDESGTKQIVAILVTVPGPFSGMLHQDEPSEQLILGNFIEVKLEI